MKNTTKVRRKKSATTEQCSG